MPVPVIVVTGPADDRAVLSHFLALHGFCYQPACDLRQTQPRRQLDEVLDRFDLRGQLRPFRRCIRCNGVLAAASRRALAGAVKPEILARHASFRRCRGCGQVYWPGSHYDRMRELVAALDRA